MKSRANEISNEIEDAGGGVGDESDRQYAPCHDTVRIGSAVALVKSSHDHGARVEIMDMYSWSQYEGASPVDRSPNGFRVL